MRVVLRLWGRGSVVIDVLLFFLSLNCMGEALKMPLSQILVCSSDFRANYEAKPNSWSLKAAPTGNAVTLPS